MSEYSTGSDSEAVDDLVTQALGCAREELRVLSMSDVEESLITETRLRGREDHHELCDAVEDSVSNKR